MLLSLLPGKTRNKDDAVPLSLLNYIPLARNSRCRAVSALRYESRLGLLDVAYAGKQLLYSRVSLFLPSELVVESANGSASSLLLRIAVAGGSRLHVTCGPGKLIFLSGNISSVCAFLKKYTYVTK